MELVHDANALFVDELYADAADAYVRAIDTLSRDSSSTNALADAHAKHAAALLKLRKLRDAIAAADRAIALDNALAMAHLRKGCVYCALSLACVCLHCMCDGCSRRDNVCSPLDCAAVSVAHFELDEFRLAKQALAAGAHVVTSEHEALRKRFQTWLRKCDAELDGTSCDCCAVWMIMAPT